jgi:hypothetical protein
MIAEDVGHSHCLCVLGASSPIFAVQAFALMAD